MLPQPDYFPSISLFRHYGRRQHVSPVVAGLVAVLLTVLSAVPAFAQQPPAPALNSGPAVWNLSPGDAFRAAVITDRTTTITVNGQSLPPQKSNDTLQLEYRLRMLVPDGDAIFQVRIISADMGEGTLEENGTSARSELINEAAQRKLLQLPPITLQVAPSGQITLSAQNHTRLLEQLAANDAASFSLLKKASPHEICSSWFGRPFWFPSRSLLTDARAPWTAVCTDSCGPFGVLQTEVTLERLPAEKGLARCSLTGTPRFVPLVLPAKNDADAPLPIADLKVETAEFSGFAFLELDQPDAVPVPGQAQTPQPEPASGPGTEPPRARPPFRILDTLLKISGRGTPSENLKSQLKADEFEFEFTQKSRFIISDYAFRENDRLQVFPR